MTIRPKQIEIPTDDPFKNCKLGRKQYADALTTIVQHYADGFVLAINNEWGTGKTTFIKMWEQLLKTQGVRGLGFTALRGCYILITNKNAHASAIY